MKKFTKLNIAIIHDSLRYFGGAERVLETLHQIWPEAPVYTSTICWEKLGPFRERVKRFKPITTWAQRVPLFRFYPFLYRYLLPCIWCSLDLSGYDIVVSSSYAQMSHLVRTRPGALHICYSHSPPRHLYGYETDLPWERVPLLNLLARFINTWLRKVDYAAAQRVTSFIANSKEVAIRIKKFYGRESKIIYPPVALPEANVTIAQSDYYLVVSRLSRMKHVDLVISACNRLGIKLKVVGIGPEEKHLKVMSGKTVELLGQVSDAQLMRLYAGCRAVICAAKEEDFGIVPIEAMSFGKPVIAYRSGGYKETVLEGQTGIFFRELNHTSLQQILEKFQTLTFSASSCRRRAHEYSRAIFQRRIRQVVSNAWKKSQLPKEHGRM